MDTRLKYIVDREGASRWSNRPDRNSRLRLAPEYGMVNDSSGYSTWVTLSSGEVESLTRIGDPSEN